MRKIAFEKFVLPNGLTVIFHEDRSSPLVAVNLWYHVGSKDEEPGRTGFAHLFEHLMFMGSKNAPYPSFDSIMESWGGHNNGTTSNDRTNYYEIGPTNLLETCLWLEADRLATLADVITEEELERQRKVVQNERRQSYENRPYGQSELAIPEAMYTPDHPYHWPTIGSHADLEAAGVADVRAFFERYYLPSNASLVVAGDFDFAAGRALVEKYFGWIPKRPAPSRRTPPPAVLDGNREITLTDRVQLPRLRLCWHSPPLFARGRRGSGSGGADPGRRQVEPSVQEPGLRAADGAGRVRLPELADAGQPVPRRRHREAGRDPGSDPAGGRRGAAVVRDQGADRRRDRSRAQQPPGRLLQEPRSPADARRRLEPLRAPVRRPRRRRARSHALRDRGSRVGARRAGGDHRAQPPGAAHGSRRDRRRRPTRTRRRLDRDARAHEGAAAGRHAAAVAHAGDDAVDAQQRARGGGNRALGGADRLGQPDAALGRRLAIRRGARGWRRRRRRCSTRARGHAPRSRWPRSWSSSAPTCTWARGATDRS